MTYQLPTLRQLEETMRPTPYGFIYNIFHDGSFDFTDDSGEEGCHVGLNIDLEDFEYFDSDENGKLTIAGGRFVNFVLNKKFRFKVSYPITYLSNVEMSNYFSFIGSNVSDQWSVIIYESHLNEYKYKYEAVFYFRRKADALMFKMSI